MSNNLKRAESQKSSQFTIFYIWSSHRHLREKYSEKHCWPSKTFLHDWFNPTLQLKWYILDAREQRSCISGSRGVIFAKSKITRTYRNIFLTRVPQLFPFGLKCAWSAVVVTMNLQYFTELKRARSLTAIKWLQRRSLLANPLHCATYNCKMDLVSRMETHVDSYQW